MRGKEEIDSTQAAAAVIPSVTLTVMSTPAYRWLKSNIWQYFQLLVLQSKTNGSDLASSDWENF